MRGLAREHLAELRDLSIAPEVMAAVREGRVIPRSAAWLLVKLGITTETLIAWLGCGDESERAMAIEAAYLMADTEERFGDRGLATATRAALRAGADLDLRSARQKLDRYLADALGAEPDDSQSPGPE
ncbi:hypothetical protein [Nannocystis radixulma]|uniref:Uncharacterized protein n=1 Tax=Nannocystis radixulma TaxID=2995305 RepID=A0ABT5BEL1_9BACT|nr:hypothetical protein [Nannocystis radixulma]MDC0672138.1 hypothetical protein [Nannocystis radixulma]